MKTKLPYTSPQCNVIETTIITMIPPIAPASQWNPLAKEAGLPFVELDGEEEWDVNTHDWQIQ